MVLPMQCTLYSVHVSDAMSMQAYKVTYFVANTTTNITCRYLLFTLLAHGKGHLSPCNNENRKHKHVGYLQVTIKSSYKCTSVTMTRTVTYSVQFTSLYFIILCLWKPKFESKANKCFQTNGYRLLDTTCTILQFII